MIVYDLICSRGHNFEGWFNDLTDLKDQIEKHELLCPVCGESSIERKPSTFGLVKGQAAGEATPSGAKAELTEEGAKVAELYRQFVKFSQKIEEDYSDVGNDFSAEALKMHYGVSPRRNIRGKSTAEEERMLKDEGVDFCKVPMLVRKRSLI